MQNPDFQVAYPKFLPLFILFMVPLTGMGIDLYTPSLPWIAKAFEASAHLVKLTIAAYLFGYALGPLFGGSLSDAWGRRPVLIAGMLIYIISCLMIVLFPGIHLMLWMRFVQGIGAAFLGVTFRSLASDAFEGLVLKKMGASMGLAWSLGPIVAPFIGGYLQHYFGWQSNFIFFIVYAALVLLIGFFIPETNKHRVPLHPKTIISHYRTIFSHPVFWMSVLCMGIGYGLIIIFNVVGPFLVQDMLHFSAVEFGYIALFMGFALFLGMILNRILVHYYPVKSLIKFGLFIGVIFIIIFLTLGLLYPINLYRFIVPVFCILFSASFIFPHCMALVMGLFPKSAGAAAAMSGTMMSLIGTISSVFASFLLATTQVPMATCYLAMLIICMLGFFSVTRRHAID